MIKLTEEELRSLDFAVDPTNPTEAFRLSTASAGQNRKTSHNRRSVADLAKLGYLKTARFVAKCITGVGIFFFKALDVALIMVEWMLAEISHLFMKRTRQLRRRTRRRSYHKKS